jgi:hypothetical protein
LYDALVALSVDFVVPGDPAARVIPCNFMQLRYAANAVLLGLLNPPTPPVWYFAQAFSAVWNFGLLANPPAPAGGPLAPAGGPLAPVGGTPPEAPEGGEPNPPPLGSLTPCWARQDVNAVVPADELEPLGVVVFVVFVAELLPHAASARLAPIMPRMTTGRIGCRKALRTSVKFIGAF